MDVVKKWYFIANFLNHVFVLYPFRIRIKIKQLRSGGKSKAVNGESTICQKAICQNESESIKRQRRTYFSLELWMVWRSSDFEIKVSPDFEVKSYVCFNGWNLDNIVLFWFLVKLKMQKCFHFLLVILSCLIHF